MIKVRFHMRSTVTGEVITADGESIEDDDFDALRDAARKNKPPDGYPIKIAADENERCWLVFNVEALWPPEPVTFSAEELK
jgi:hypothetical protein